MSTTSSSLLETVEFSWFGRHPFGDWRNFVETLRMGVRNIVWAPWLASAFALPRSLDPSQFFARIEAHPMDGESARAHWLMKFERVRGPVPPREIADSSARVGGLETLLERLVAQWPADRKIELTTKAMFMVDNTKWRSPFSTRMPSSKRSPGGLALTPVDTLTRWRVDEGEGGRRFEVTEFVSIDKHVRPVGIEWTETIELRSDLVEWAEREAWAILAKCITRRRG